LICNAGGMAKALTLTSEGLEVTFASHLLFGTYLLTKLALNHLKPVKDSRVIVMSSGGMYNSAFPEWSVATGMKGTFNEQLAYAYAKRGQVLFCEEMSKLHPSIKFVSCHPGWTLTEGVEGAYGENKKYLEPLRSLWEGAEGVCWLAVVPAEQLQAGAFYLDRSPQVKHLAGAFMSEGSYTKNSEAEIKAMMQNLEDWSDKKIRPALTLSNYPRNGIDNGTNPLKETDKPVDLQRFMGNWIVHANIPTYFDVDSTDNVENYTWDEKNQIIRVRFMQLPKGSNHATFMQQKARISNNINTRWAISPKIGGFFLPLGLPYLILYCSDNYDLCIIGVEERNYLWIMGRETTIDKDRLEEAIRLAVALGHRRELIKYVPWTGKLKVDDVLEK
jgi:lipocalin